MGKTFQVHFKYTLMNRSYRKCDIKMIELIEKNILEGVLIIENSIF